MDKVNKFLQRSHEFNKKKHKNKCERAKAFNISEDLVIVLDGVILYWFSYFNDANRKKYHFIYNSVSLCGMAKNENKWKSEETVNFQFPKCQRDHPKEWEQKTPVYYSEIILNK